jgi:hypothetical protein
VNGGNQAHIAVSSRYWMIVGKDPSGKGMVDAEG